MTTPSWNVMFGWPNLADTGTLSGGSWLAALPLTNLQDRRLHRVARSSDDAPASSLVNVDLGAASTVRLVALLGHNFSTAAVARIRAWNGAVPILENTAFDGWTDVGTPVVTTGQADPLGGTLACLLEDNDGAAAEAKYKAVTFTGDGTKALSIALKKGTATVQVFGLYDNSAAAWRHQVTVTWTGGVPVLTTTAGAGSIAATPSSLGGGWYQIHVTAASVVAANANRFYLYPADASAADTGTVYAYQAQAWDLADVGVKYDSGVVAAWPSGVTAAQMGTFQPAYVLVLSADVAAQYWRVEVGDPSNTDTFIDLGRLVIAPVFQPTVNLAYGAAQGWEDDSTVTPTDGGAVIVAARSRRRTLTATLPDLPQAEALANLWEMQRQCGTTGQFLVVYDPTDTTHLWRRSFLARFRELNAMEQASYARYTTPIALVEDV